MTFLDLPSKLRFLTVMINGNMHFAWFVNLKHRCTFQFIIYPIICFCMHEGQPHWHKVAAKSRGSRMLLTQIFNSFYSFIYLFILLWVNIFAYLFLRKITI